MKFSFYLEKIYKPIIFFFISIITWGNESDSIQLEINDFEELNSIQNESNTYIKISELEKELTKKTYSFNNKDFSEFTDERLLLEFPQDESINEAIGMAKASIEEVDQNNSWVGSFGDDDLAFLPLGIKHNQQTENGNV